MCRLLYFEVQNEIVKASYAPASNFLLPVSFARVGPLIEDNVVQLSVTRESVPPNQSELLLALVL